MVIDLTWEMVVLNVISWPVGVAAKFSTIAKICKYRKLHEGHHFIIMAMEMHDALWHDMDRFIKVCVCFFHDKQSKGHLSLFFFIQFLRQHVSIVFLACFRFCYRKENCIDM